MFQRQGSTNRSHVALGVLAAATFIPSFHEPGRGDPPSPGTGAGAVVERSPHASPPHQSQPAETVLQPVSRRERNTPPLKRIHGETTQQIIESLIREDPDPLLARYISALQKSARNPKALELVLTHMRDLSHILEGHPLRYEESLNVQALAGEPSAYRLLLIKFMSLAHFFPKDLGFEGGELLRGRDPSAELLEALQLSLEANLGLARHVIPNKDGSINDRSLTFVPHYSIFSDANFKIEPASLIGRVRGGYFEELITYLDCLPPIPSDLARPIVTLFDAAIVLRGEDSTDALHLVGAYIKDARRFHDISPSLGQAYLTCLTSFQVRDLRELAVQASLLRTYIDGLLRNNEPNPAAGVFSIAALGGALWLDAGVVENLVLLHRHTGFSQVERLQDRRLDHGSGSGGALTAYLNELATFIRDPKFREHSKIGAVVFAGTQDVLNSGTLLSHIETYGYVLLPFEAYTDSDLAQACEATRTIAGRPADLVVVIGDGLSAEQLASEKSEEGQAMPGNPMGVTDEAPWFAPINQESRKKHLAEERTVASDFQSVRDLPYWIKENTANSPITTGRATLDTADAAVFDRLANASMAQTQFLFIGSNTAAGADNPARRIHLATGCDVFGSADFMTGLDIAFDEYQRVSGMQFRHSESGAGAKNSEGEVASSKPRSVESIWYRAKK